MKVTTKNHHLIEKIRNDIQSTVKKYDAQNKQFLPDNITNEVTEKYKHVIIGGSDEEKASVQEVFRQGIRSLTNTITKQYDGGDLSESTRPKPLLKGFERINRYYAVDREEGRTHVPVMQLTKDDWIVILRKFRKHRKGIEAHEAEIITLLKNTMPENVQEILYKIEE